MQVRFGIFQFDTGSRELRRDGALVRLAAQPAQVLALLVAKAGDAVTREELCEAVWKDETHVDFERGLNFCISQIRSALEDDAARPRYIRTLPKRGYQFIAPIERVPLPEPRQHAASARFRLPRRGVVLAGALIPLAAAAWAAHYWIEVARASSAKPIVAIARFDSGDSSTARFADELTDNVIEQLASQSGDRYRVIGNAAILRQPRDQRDLLAIGAQLHAGYVVLGQVEGTASHRLVLAHLIRLPDQTHLWVARFDRKDEDLYGAEGEIARQIAGEFSSRVAKDSSGTRSPALPSH